MEAHLHHDVIEHSPTPYEGRFGRFARRLGEGAAKVVYEAIDLNYGKLVAWNEVDIAHLLPEERGRVLAEMDMLRSVQHPHIIDFYGSWSSLSRVVFITEIVESGDLQRFSKTHRIKLKVVKKWCRQILSALAYLHSFSPPIVHRDVKCENILYHASDGTVKIGDFGLSTSACVASSPDGSQPLGASVSGAVLAGTPNYMAPEMYDESYDEGVDIYAFGMCVLEMLTRTLPYDECSNAGQIYKKVVTGVPPRCLARMTSASVTSFITFCIGKGEGGKRPSAGEVLAHAFLGEGGGGEDDAEVFTLVAPEVPEGGGGGGPPGSAVGGGDAETSFQSVAEGGSPSIGQHSSPGGTSPSRRLQGGFGDSDSPTRLPYVLASSALDAPGVEGGIEDEGLLEAGWEAPPQAVDSRSSGRAGSPDDDGSSAASASHTGGRGSPVRYSEGGWQGEEGLGPRGGMARHHSIGAASASSGEGSPPGSPTAESGRREMGRLSGPGSSPGRPYLAAALGGSTISSGSAPPSLGDDRATKSAWHSMAAAEAHGGLSYRSAGDTLTSQLSGQSGGEFYGGASGDDDGGSDEEGGAEEGGVPRRFTGAGVGVGEYGSDMEADIGLLGSPPLAVLAALAREAGGRDEASTPPRSDAADLYGEGEGGEGEGGAQSGRDSALSPPRPARRVRGGPPTPFLGGQGQGAPVTSLDATEDLPPALDLGGVEAKGGGEEARPALLVVPSPSSRAAWGSEGGSPSGAPLSEVTGGGAADTPSSAQGDLLSPGGYLQSARAGGAPRGTTSLGAPTPVGSTPPPSTPRKRPVSLFSPAPGPSPSGGLGQADLPWPLPADTPLELVASQTLLSPDGLSFSVITASVAFTFPTTSETAVCWTTARELFAELAASRAALRLHEGSFVPLLAGALELQKHDFAVTVTAQRPGLKVTLGMAGAATAGGPRPLPAGNVPTQ